MSGRALWAAPSAGGGGRDPGSGAVASPCIAGRVYRIVQTTGLDGKNLLTLLPVSKPPGNLPLAQSSAMSDNAKGNTSVSDPVTLKDLLANSTASPSVKTPELKMATPGKGNTSVSGPVTLKDLLANSTASPSVKTPELQMATPGKGNTSVSGPVTLKDLLENSTASPSVKTPELKMATPGKVILPKPLGQVENMEVTTAVKENPSIPTISSIQNNYLSLQKDTPSDKSKASYVLVNSKNLPVTVKAPILPSGHHLQIPAHAEVKSVLASSLPPAIQQKILAAAPASNASGTSEAAKQSTVIYVSPVNTVKTSVSKPLQNTCPKPFAEVSKPLLLTTVQTAVSSSALEIVKSDGPKTQVAPMKWVVQENPQSPASCLVPVKSSNNVASEILKTLVGMKNVQSNSSSILPACANGLSGSQAKITSIKDNALVMYNGKVYLLTKKEAKVVSSQDDNLISSSAEIQSRKHTSHLISSAADSTITNQIVNLVLSKNKGIAFNAKDPKSCENNGPYLQYELNKSLKATSALFTSPHGSLQVSSTSQPEAISTSNPLPARMNVVQTTIAKENANHHVLEKIKHLKASSAVLQQSAMHGASKKEEQKIEKMNSLGMANQIKHRKEQQRKQYLELRKKFGLSKEERIYLRRIPLSVSLTRSETTVCSSMVQTSDPGKLLHAVAIKHVPEEEKIIGKQGEEVNIKRQAEVPPVLENTKRRKTEVKSALDPNLKCSNSYLGKDNPCSPCRQVTSQQENPTNSLQCSQGGDSDPNPCVKSHEQDVLSPALYYCENETSFNEGSFRDDIFPFSPPDLEETKRDEKITRLKLLLREQEAALEEIRKKMQKS